MSHSAPEQLEFALRDLFDRQADAITVHARAWNAAPVATTMAPLVHRAPRRRVTVAVALVTIAAVTIATLAIEYAREPTRRELPSATTSRYCTAHVEALGDGLIRYRARFGSATRPTAQDLADAGFIERTTPGFDIKYRGPDFFFVRPLECESVGIPTFVPGTSG